MHLTHILLARTVGVRRSAAGSHVVVSPSRDHQHRPRARPVKGLRCAPVLRMACGHPGQAPLMRTRLSTRREGEKDGWGLQRGAVSEVYSRP